MHLPTLLSLAGLFLSAPLLASAAPHHTSGMTPTQRQRRATHHGLSRRQSQASPSAGPTLCVLQCPVADQNNVGSTSQDTDGEGNLVCQYDRNQPACVYSNPAGQAMGGNAASCPVAAQKICPNRKRDPQYISSRQAAPPTPGGRAGKAGRRLKTKRDMWRSRTATMTTGGGKESASKRATTGGVLTGGGIAGVGEGRGKGGLTVLGTKLESASGADSASKME